MLNLISTKCWVNEIAGLTAGGADGIVRLTVESETEPKAETTLATSSCDLRLAVTSTDGVRLADEN
jgi:hypothetical protein